MTIGTSYECTAEDTKESNRKMKNKDGETQSLVRCFMGAELGNGRK